MLQLDTINHRSVSGYVRRCIGVANSDLWMYRQQGYVHTPEALLAWTSAELEDPGLSYALP